MSDAQIGQDMAQLSDGEILARAVLLFFSESPWTKENQEQWLALTGASAATTRSLCDLARALVKGCEDGTTS